MGYARYIGRIGALAAALGAATVVVNTPGVALAEDLGSNAASAEQRRARRRRQLRNLSPVARY